MINILRRDTDLVVKINTGDLGFTYELTWNCKDNAYAELLARKMTAELTGKLEAIRQEAYLDGYKDGRAKRGKKTWFKRWW